jgi:hypothetical protein
MPGRHASARRCYYLFCLGESQADALFGFRNKHPFRGLRISREVESALVFALVHENGASSAVKKPYVRSIGRRHSHTQGALSFVQR